MVQGLPIPEGEGTEGRWSEKTILDYAFRILQGLPVWSMPGLHITLEFPVGPPYDIDLSGQGRNIGALNGLRGRFLKSNCTL